MYEVNELTFLNLVSTTFRGRKKAPPHRVIVRSTGRVEGQVSFKYVININTNYLLFDFRSIKVSSEKQKDSLE